MKEIKKLQVPSEEGATFIRSQGNQLMLKAIVQPVSNDKEYETKVLLDSGCTGSSMDKAFAIKNNIPLKRLLKPMKVLNADGTENKGGMITHTTQVRMRLGHKHWETIEFAITTLSDFDLYLGYDWLVKHNPEIDWRK